MDSKTLTQLLADKYGAVLDAQIEAFVAEFNENAKITLQNEPPKQYVEEPYVEELGADDAHPIPKARKRKFDEFSRNTARQNNEYTEFEYERYGQYISPDYFMYNTSDQRKNNQ